MSEIIRVGMADYKVCRPPQKISTLGLGSCLGVVLYDEKTKISAMAHIMMPDSTKIKKVTNRKKFADTCLPDMYREMIYIGAQKKNIVAKIAGGAKMFSYQTNNTFLNIGEQNVQATRELLAEWKIPIIAEDTGGGYGRTIEFDSTNGKLTIKTVGKGTSII